MRILLTADPELPVPPTRYGGIERIVGGLIRQLRESGHAVALAARPGSTAPADRLYPWPGLRSQSLAATWRNGHALRRAADDFRPDVVHSFSRLAYLLPLLLRGAPRIVMSYQRHPGERPVRRANRLAQGNLEFTGCSEYICRLGRVGGGRWTAIPNFADTAAIAFTPAVPADAPLLFLSRIESVKGPQVAIAAARAAGRRLILAGNHAAEGPEATFWQEQIQPQLGCGDVTWVGEVDDRQKSELLGQAAALVVPIQWDEPFGIVFAEALAAGTPVITCGRGAAPEIIRDGEDGFLVEGPAEAAAAIARLGQIDRAGCRRRAEALYSPAAVAARYVELYRRLTVPPA